MWCKFGHVTPQTKPGFRNLRIHALNDPPPLPQPPHQPPASKSRLEGPLFTFLHFRLRVSDFGFRVSNFKCRVSGFGFRVQTCSPEWIEPTAHRLPSPPLLSRDPSTSSCLSRSGSDPPRTVQSPFLSRSFLSRSGSDVLAPPSWMGLNGSKTEAEAGLSADSDGPASGAEFLLV